jgi:hypothetical protein
MLSTLTFNFPAGVLRDHGRQFIDGTCDQRLALPLAAMRC